jgi:hypothetical protein
LTGVQVGSTCGQTNMFPWKSLETFCLEHLEQKTLRQSRQWWRRLQARNNPRHESYTPHTKHMVIIVRVLVSHRIAVNDLEQARQIGASLLGCHSGRAPVAAPAPESESPSNFSMNSVGSHSPFSQRIQPGSSLSGLQPSDEALDLGAHACCLLCQM